MPKKDLTVAIAILVNRLFKPCNKKQIHYYNLPVVFRANYKLNNFFAFKSKILMSFYDIVCKFQCCDCNDRIKVRMYGHLGIYALIEKRLYIVQCLYSPIVIKSLRVP